MPRIVVGIDGSPAADAALAFALEEARLRKLPLRIVSASEVPPVEYAGSAFIPAADLATEAEHHADDVLARALETIGPDPGVEVETVAIHGHPANVLADESQNAAILVVGTRGRSGLKGIVLGSVSQALAHRCAGPLVIVPAPHEPAEPPTA